MLTDPGFLFLLSIIFGFLWAALQMTGSKLLAIIMMVLCFESLWLLLEPVPSIFWWGVITIPIVCGFYGWWIYEPITAPIPSPQISSTNQGGGITANYGSVVINPAPHITQVIPTPRRLHFEFSEELINRSNPNVFDIVVSVHNPTESTILNVSVCIESIRKLQESDDSDIARLLPAFRNLSLPLRDEHTTPPRREIDVHPDLPVVFKLVTLQRHLPQQGQNGEILLHHTQWQVEKNSPRFDSPYQRPHGALPLGRYQVRLRAQGRDVPAERLTIEFENVAGRAQAWQVS